MKPMAKRVLSMLCALVMVLSVAGMVVPAKAAAATNEIDAIPQGHLVCVRDYSYFAYDAEQGTNYVDDAEAFGGKAVAYSRSTLDDSSFLAIYRYDAASGLSDAEMKIGQLMRSDLKINQGYQVYKFNYAVPENITQGNVLYMMNNWQLNSAQLSKDFAPYAGKTVEVYFSIKVTGPVDGLYTISVDRVALATVCADYMENGTCTQCGAEDAFGKIPAGHLGVVRDYSYFSTQEGMTAYVDDAEAFGGKAVCYSQSTMDDSNFISINRYDVASGLSDAQLRIGTLMRKDLKINQGYQVYKFRYAVPEGTTNGNVFYIMNNWQLNSAQLAKDFAPYAGKTVEVYLSIKVTGPVNGLYSVYVDRVAIATTCDDSMQDGVCTQCGKVDALLSKVDSAHLASVRYYSDFNTAPAEGTDYVDDADAFGGKAVRYSKAVLTSHPAVSINRYDVGSGLGDGHASLRIGTLSLDQLKPNTGYQLHKFTYDVPEETTAGNVIYIMSNWQLNSSSFCADFAAYAGKTVEVYFSMKVTGPDADGLYSVYVDRVAIATTCDAHMDENGVCAVCGKAMAITFYANDFTLAYAPIDSVVADPDSQYGSAALVSYASRAATGDAGLVNAVTFGSEEGLELRTNSDRLLGKKPFATLYNNAQKGTYVTYKYEDVDLTDVNFMFLFSCWGFQMKLDNYKETLRNKLVNVYVSMKIVGDIGVNADFYIDKVEITGEDREVDELVPAPMNITLNADNFNLPYAPIDAIVTDGEDRVAKLSYADRAGDAGLANAMLRRGVQKLELYSFCAPDTYVLVGGISIPRLQYYAGKGYVSYTFQNIVPVPTADNFFMYMFDCWGFQAALTDGQRAQLVGKTVDVTLTMKVEGDVTDAETAPAYYIKSIQITDPANAECAHEITAWSIQDEDVHIQECFQCGATLATEAHTWDEGVITIAPSVEAEGEKIYTCSVCNGIKKETLPAIVNPVETWTLILGDHIGVKFAMNLADGDAVGVTVNGKPADFSLDAGVLSVKLAAVQMMDEVVISVNGVALPNTYSVREYADYILAGDYSEATKNLVKAMLCYGASAQSYFGYNTENLANNGVSVTEIPVPAAEDGMLINGSINGVTFYGASLVHNDKIAVRFYFTGDLSAIDLSGYVVGEKNGMTYIEMAGINPQDLANMFMVNLTDGSSTLTVGYAPLDYIVRMYNKEGASAQTKALVQALYTYHMAAQTYVTEG